MKRTLYHLFFSSLLVNLCHGCLNFTHHNVTFDATNFEYVLQWNKVHLPSDVLFSVQYKRYGQNGWSIFPECQNITEVYCNLTNAITGDIEDFMEHQYFGRVEALSRNCYSDWIMSKRLNTRDDTYLILPKPNYIEHVNSITILVATPFLALRSKDNKPMTVEELYKDYNFEYHLSFFDAEQRELLQEPQKHNKFDVSGLSPNTEYSGSVCIMIGDKQKSNAQNFVVKTLPDHSLVTLIVSLISNLAAVLGIATLYLSCKYVRHQAKTPSSLDFKKVTRIPPMTARKEKCSSCTLGFSSSTFPMRNYSDLTQCKDQSENVLPIAYASHFQPSTSNQTSISNLGSPLPSHANLNLPQNNKRTDSSVQYVGLYEDSSMEYQSNHIPKHLNEASYNSQSEFQTIVHQPLDNGTLNELVNNGDTFSLSLSLFSQKPNNYPDLSLGLMSSVVVHDSCELMGQGGNTETPLSLSDVFFPGLPNDPVENNVLENSLSEHGSNHFRLQLPVEDSQHSFTNETFIFEQPYRFQH
ncbi:interleukin-22 receptor subunit alpha-1 [Mantella aurantiaca]